MKGLIFYLQRFTMTGTPSDDVLLNTLEGNEVLAYGGNDSITNMADNASIYAGDGADTVQNYYWDGVDAVYIDGGAGADSISNSENYEVTILGGNDNDTIQNTSGSYASINSGYGKTAFTMHRQSMSRLTAARATILLKFIVTEILQ